MHPEPRTSSSATGAQPAWPGAWWGTVIVVIALVVYWPALGGDPLWDDAGHLTAPELQTVEGLKRIWFEPGATQQYYPLLHSAFWLEHRVWGDLTAGYHLVNVLLHATAACLFAALLRRLGVRGGWYAAVLFTLHPVATESVAWISEQKNTLSLVLALAAALAYLRFEGDRRPARYGVATLLFVGALLSKSITATLPGALLVLAWWRRGRLELRRDVLPLGAWLLLGVMAGLYTASFERTSIGAQGAAFALEPMERLLLAARVPWFYLGQLIWPANLSFNYPRWHLDSGDVMQYGFVAATVGVLALATWWARRERGPLAAVLLFGGLLFPVLGFVNVFPFVYSFVADHFQYHASLVAFAVAGAALAAPPRRTAWGVTAACACALGTMTWAQAGLYRDDATLYRATLARNPRSWFAHNNLGTTLVNAGRAAEAERHFVAALRLRPNFAEAENNLGDCLTRLGRAAEAVPHLERALSLQRRYADAQNNLGTALMALGRAEEGKARFAEAVRLKPELAVAHFNLGLATASGGQPAAAIDHFAEALRLQPGNAEAELNLGLALALSGRFAEAEPHFDRALRLKPDNPAAHLTYGRVLAREGRFDAALSHCRQAVELNRADPIALLQLADVLRQMGRTAEAEQYAREAARLR